MTRTSHAAELTAGAAADAGTIRALECAAIVEQLAALTAFEPSRELAAATVPMADAVHVGLLQDQTDEAERLIGEQAQATIGGARDIRGALERAVRGGRLTAEELLDIGATSGATERFAARLATWRGPHLAGVRDALDPAPELAAANRAQRRRGRASCSTRHRPSWRRSESGCEPRRTASASGSTP